MGRWRLAQNAELAAHFKNGVEALNRLHEILFKFLVDLPDDT